MNRTIQFNFPASLTVEQCLTQLNQEHDCKLVAEHSQLKTYYDSFDWRLYASGIIAECVGSTFTLTSIQSNLLLASVSVEQMPRFSEQFEDIRLRHQLEPILEMRALLPVCSVQYTTHKIKIINDDKKIVLRLTIEEYQQIANRIFLHPLKGYDKEAKAVIQRLNFLGFTSSSRPVLELVLEQQGITVNDYSSKLNIKLRPEMRVDVASQLIYKQLLATMQANEQGIIDDIDSEFLHDFRVSVRRTRSALSQLKLVFPDDIQARYRDFFSWLGKITCVTRDLDVYLLNFSRLKNSLPIAMREYLNPLHDFLQQKRQYAQQALVKQLRSVDYVLTLNEWEQILNEPLLLHPIGINATLAIKPLADKRLWKTYQRVVREGEAINDLSPCVALHELRKTCKKLRYSIEFFQSLYPESKIKTLLKALKVLQEVLGDYQDCEVQEHNLRLFCEEMQAMQNAPDETFVAIDQLIQDLKMHKSEIRCHFSDAFTVFIQEDFKALLKAE